MAEKQTQSIKINDVDYNLEDLTTEQQAVISHISDLDRKIGSTQFNLDQLRVGREAFVNMLIVSVEEEE
jgi:peptidoglycan hydrolase CwlO-like protein